MQQASLKLNKGSVFRQPGLLGPRPLCRSLEWGSRAYGSSQTIKNTDWTGSNHSKKKKKETQPQISVQREAAHCDSRVLLFMSCRELRRPLLELDMKPLIGHKIRGSLPLLKQKLYWCTDPGLPGLWPGTVWKGGTSWEFTRVSESDTVW